MTEGKIKYAGFSKRLLAHNVDLLPILILLYASSLIIPKTAYDWVFYSLIYFGYHIMFELSPWRATPGKRWAKIYVAPEKGDTKIIFIVIRNLAKVISLIFLFGGFILIIFSNKRKALHDYLAGTVVLFDEH